MTSLMLLIERPWTCRQLSCISQQIVIFIFLCLRLPSPASLTLENTPTITAWTASRWRTGLPRWCIDDADLMELKAPDGSDPKEAKAKGNIAFPGLTWNRAGGLVGHRVTSVWRGWRATGWLPITRQNFTSTGWTSGDGSIPNSTATAWDPLLHLGASRGGDRHSVTVNGSKTRKRVAVVASRRQQAGASSRPQHRQRKWTEAATVS